MITGMMESDPNTHPQILSSKKLVSGRKVFYLDLKENARGRFLQVTEDVGGRRNRVMLPIESMHEFAEGINQLVAENDQLEQP